MSDTAVGKVVNCHWFGGNNKLPPNTIYIGRPGPYGNNHSSKKGNHTREECIALNRIDLYRELIKDPSRLVTLRQELMGKDLGCWCKQPKRVVGCHGDNYLHILSPRLEDRTYDKSLVSYVMDDLRFCLTTFSEWVFHQSDKRDFLPLYIHLGDVKIEAQNLILVAKKREISSDDACDLLMTIVIDLELALQETDLKLVEYWFNHAMWICDRFVNRWEDRLHEPMAPDIPLKRIAKKGKQI